MMGGNVCLKMRRGQLRLLRVWLKGEKGISLLETVVALALLGIIGVNFLGATATTSSSRLKADEHNSARMVAESQMESIKKLGYADTGYSVNETLLADYPGYDVQVATDNVGTGLQKITITVSHHGKEITSLECYKAQRVDETSNETS
jgi:Tfp pilus assembly protein PilV